MHNYVLIPCGLTSDAIVTLDIIIVNAGYEPYYNHDGLLAFFGFMDCQFLDLARLAYKMGALFAIVPPDCRSLEAFQQYAHLN